MLDLDNLLPPNHGHDAMNIRATIHVAWQVKRANHTRAADIRGLDRPAMPFES
jgi:hypothetical protein